MIIYFDIYITYGIHQPNYLKGQHILTQVIAYFVNYINRLASLRILESQK